MLNALRHQWNHHATLPALPAGTNKCSTPCGINGIITLKAGTEAATLGLCSTPCGINGIITRGACLINRRDAVLNALRHQWNHHQASCVSSCAACSAQRLAASMESSPRRPPVHIWLVAVLNALRHQWNHHVLPRQDEFDSTCSTPCGINGIITAGSLPVSCVRCVCSTPCGINGIITPRRVIARRRASAQRLAASMESSHAL